MYIYVHLSACMYIYVHVHVRTSTCFYVHVCTSTCMYVRIDVVICVISLVGLCPVSLSPLASSMHTSQTWRTIWRAMTYTRHGSTLIRVLFSLMTYHFTHTSPDCYVIMTNHVMENYDDVKLMDIVFCCRSTRGVLESVIWMEAREGGGAVGGRGERWRGYTKLNKFCIHIHTKWRSGSKCGCSKGQKASSKASSKCKTIIIIIIIII